MSSTLKREKILVAAIDFGTTYSGYAYSFKEDFKRDPKDIYANTDWGGNSVMSLKTITCALFDEDQQFHSFGYEAESEYTSLAANNEHHKWYFFKRFKMQLHRKDVHIKRDMMLEDIDVSPKEMQAMTVFAESIRYLKDHLLETLEKQGTTTQCKDIHWILTVPAIWKDAAKQFMRESAQQADIEGDQLTIALEPEAASMYVQIASDGAKRAIEEPGTKFMVIDMGGGTVDITMHENRADGTMHELHQPGGGPCGGTVVDTAFTDLLRALVGADVLSHIHNNDKNAFLDTEREFEMKKRTVKHTGQATTRVRVPVSFTERYEKVTEEDISVGIENSKYQGKLTWKRDLLTLKSDTMKDLFEEPISEMSKILKTLLKQPKVKGTGVFLLVGGFAESKLVQGEIEKVLKAENVNAKVIIPKDAGLAVVKGAVLFGHQPVKIQSRIAKYTFGVNISPTFDEASHPNDRRVTVDTVHRCRDVFKKYIELGEELEVGQEKSGKHIGLKADQEEMILEVYASEKRDPKFVDEDGTECVGDLVVPLTKRGTKVKVEVKMIFGDTELAVQAQEENSHSKVQAYFDFL